MLKHTTTDLLCCTNHQGCMLNCSMLRKLLASLPDVKTYCVVTVQLAKKSAAVAWADAVCKTARDLLVVVRVIVIATFYSHQEGHKLVCIIFDDSPQSSLLCQVDSKDCQGVIRLS